MPRPKGVGMPKPKKEKLQDVNDDSQPSIMDAVIDADPSKGSAARPSLVEEATVCPCHSGFPEFCSEGLVWRKFPQYR